MENENKVRERELWHGIRLTIWLNNGKIITETIMESEDGLDIGGILASYETALTQFVNKCMGVQEGVGAIKWNNLIVDVREVSSIKAETISIAASQYPPNKVAGATS